MISHKKTAIIEEEDCDTNKKKTKKFTQTHTVNMAYTATAVQHVEENPTHKITKLM